jgi:hypothetical protein
MTIAHELNGIADTLSVWADERHEPGPHELRTLAETHRALSLLVSRLEAAEVAQVTWDNVADIFAEMEDAGDA